MEGRRRLFLLAVILVAVAIGAVGVTLVSLFATAMEQERQALLTRLHDAPVPEGAHGLARLAQQSGSWQPLSGALPDVLRLALPTTVDAAGSVQWVEAADGDYLAAVRADEAGNLQVAWSALDSVREPYRRAALHALLGILALVGGGLWLFYRMTAPLLRSMALSEARYRMLFSSTAEGVVLVGESRIEECNDRFCEMFHCERGQVVGMPWRDFFRRHADSDERLAEFERQLRRTLEGRSPSFLWAFVPVTGEEMIAEVALRTLRDGERTLVLASLRDVTGRERTARELQRAEKALHESRERLAQAGRSSALVELAAGIAHEVNQPLAAIANYAQACRRMVGDGKPCGQDVATSLDRIAEQAQRAGEAIHRIRSLVQVQDARDAVTCINALVESVVHLLGEDIERAHTRLVLDLAADMVPVQADPLQIQQVLVQLVHNALEAMLATPPAEREIRISTRRLGDEVEVEVADTGHGIAADDRSRLFEPFFSTRENGMGMGLAISMSIIRSHQGMLDIEEGQGRGARARFRLPADTSATGSDERCRNPVVP